MNIRFGKLNLDNKVHLYKNNEMIGVGIIVQRIFAPPMHSFLLVYTKSSIKPHSNITFCHNKVKFHHNPPCFQRLYIRKLYYTRRSEGQTVTTLHFLTTSHNYPLVAFHSFISTDSLSVIKNRNLPYCSRTQDLNLLESMTSALLWRRLILNKPIC